MSKHPCPLRNIAFLPLLPLVCGLATGQGLAWRRQPLLESRTAFDAAYDPIRQRLVLHGGSQGSRQLSDTWEWDGSQWHARRPPSPPGIRARELAYWPAQRATVAVAAGRPLEPWLWDGQTWRKQTTSGAPSSIAQPLVSVDGRTGELVLYGIRPSTSPSVEMWTLGTRWTHRHRGLPPFLMSDGQLAWCEAIRRTVLVGRDTNGVSRTAIWQGTRWSFPGTTPPLLAVTEFGRSILGVGRDPTAPWQSVVFYLFDGSRWNRVSAAPIATTNTSYVRFVATATSFVLLIGRNDRLETWYPSAAGWKRWQPRRPANTNLMRIAHDEVRDFDVLLIPTSTGVETWIHDERGFHELTPPRTPPVLGLFDLVWHTRLGGVLAVSDASPNPWLFDGSTWNEIRTAGRPGKMQGDLGYDIQRDRVVVKNTIGETWEWSPRTGWYRAATSGGPLATAPIAFDERRKVLVCHVLRETWEWNGSTWRRRMTNTVPPDYGGTLVPALGRSGVLLVSGWERRTISRHMTRRTWLFDGIDWREQSVGRYDPGGWVDARNAVLDRGRQRIRIYYADLRIWDLRDQPLTVDRTEPRAGQSVGAAVSWPSQARRAFVMNLALTSQPGVRSPGSSVLLPLTPDALFAASFGLGFLRIIDGTGATGIRFTIPNLPALAGTRLFAAGWTVGPNGIGAATNEVMLDIIR